MKKCFLTLILVMTARLACAVDLHWVMDPHLYENYMTVYGEVQIDGVVQNDGNLEIGAFCGDELRGSVLPYYSNLTHKYVHEILIYGDNPCTIYLRIYDHNTDTELTAVCGTTFTYEANEIIGNEVNPQILNFVSAETAYTFTGSGSWTDPSNWTAPGGSTPTSMPDLTNEDVVVDGMAQITNGTFATVKSLAINTYKVVEIKDGASLTVIGEVSNDDDASSLVLNDGGQIFQNNENVKATFRKNITNPAVWGSTRNGWQFISTPIENTTIESFISQDTDYDLYIWDGSEELEWINYKNHIDDDDYEDYFGQFLNCENEYGYGYLVSYKTASAAVFSGTLRNLEEGGFEFDVYGQKNGEWENLNLLGNPFPFDINSSDFDRSKVASGFATIDPSTNSIVYNSDEGIIKVGQGFFVQATGKGPSLSYPSESKSTRETLKYIDFTVSGKEGHDNVILNFSGSENEGFVKLTSFNESIATIFTVDDDKMYGIANYDDNVKEIPLSFDAKEIGTYTISMKPSGDFDYIHLIDRMTGEDTDMLLEGEYRFNAMSNDDVNRFVVRLSDNNEVNDDENFVYQSGNQLFVNEAGFIQIIDMTGRVVMSGTLSDNQVDISGLRNAAYIVRLVSENGVKTQKIVVL